MTGLIERWRDRLPFDEGDPIVSLSEGSTPLVFAERVSERAGCEVWLKLEGAKAEIADKIVREIRSRLRFLNDVGLTYLSLERGADTLSGVYVKTMHEAAAV